MHILGYLVQNFIKYLHFSLENCTKCSTFAQLFEKKYNFSREAQKKKRNKLIKYSAIAATAFLVILLASVGSSSDDKENGDKTVSKEIVASDNDNTNSKEICNNI